MAASALAVLWSCGADAAPEGPPAMLDAGQLTPPDAGI